jgi:hypothetical protein
MTPQLIPESTRDGLQVSKDPVASRSLDERFVVTVFPHVEVYPPSTRIRALGHPIASHPEATESISKNRCKPLTPSSPGQ